MKRLLPPHFPVLWLTLLIFGVVGLASRSLLIGGFLLIELLFVLLILWVVRWVFRRFRSPVWLRRAVMLIPVLFVAYREFSATHGGPALSTIRFALAGHSPADIQDLHFWSDNWTDEHEVAYFRCDPASLHHILDQNPFAKRSNSFGTFPLEITQFPDLKGLPNIDKTLTFYRTDLPEHIAGCTVVTDSTFSFAYIDYWAD